MAYTATFAQSVAGTNYSGWQLKSGDQAVGIVPVPFDALGKRKQPPTEQEKKIAEIENTRRRDIFNKIAEEWEANGEVSEELIHELYDVAPQSSNFYHCKFD